MKVNRMSLRDRSSWRYWRLSSSRQRRLRWLPIGWRWWSATALRPHRTSAEPGERSGRHIGGATAARIRGHDRVRRRSGGASRGVARVHPAERRRGRLAGLLRRARYRDGRRHPHRPPHHAFNGSSSSCRAAGRSPLDRRRRRAAPVSGLCRANRKDSPSVSSRSCTSLGWPSVDGGAGVRSAGHDRPRGPPLNAKRRIRPPRCTGSSTRGHGATSGSLGAMLGVLRGLSRRPESFLKFPEVEGRNGRVDPHRRRAWRDRRRAWRDRCRRNVPWNGK